MRPIPLLTGLVLMLLVGGCATTSRECDAQRCELRIVPSSWPGVYRVEPDILTVTLTGTKTVGMIWSIDDPKARFRVGKDVALKDGVVYTDFDRGDLGDVTPCAAINDGETEASEVGTKFFCPFWKNSPMRMKARYKIRFHDGNGVQRVVDPYVANSGEGITAFSFPTPVWRKANRLTLGSCSTSATCQLVLSDSTDPGDATVDPSDLQVEASDADIELTWRMAESGARFNYEDQPRDRVDWKEVPNVVAPKCWVTDSPTGGPFPPIGLGQFMRCRIEAGSKPFFAKYVISFHGSNKVLRSASGTVSRR